MKRGFAVLLLLAPIIFGQRSRSRDPQPAPQSRQLTFDAAVTDRDGHPVAGLTAADFALSASGETQQITGLQYVDLRNHTSAGASLLYLPPEGLQRTVVLVVDDLGLSADRALELQKLLRAFAAEQLAPDDRAAIVRTSSGSGFEQRLTADRALLNEQIAHIQPVGHGLASGSYWSGLWQAVRWAITGLHAAPGRKAVVLVSENLDAVPAVPPEFDAGAINLQTFANSGAAVFYTVDPRGKGQPAAGSPLARLISQTGGLAAQDLGAVLRDQEGFYILGLETATQTMDRIPPVLELRGKILNLRWRSGYLANKRENRSMPLDRVLLIEQAIDGATTAAGMRVQITPLFVGFSGGKPVVDIIFHADGDAFSVVHDGKGMNHLSTELRLAVYGDNGAVSGPPGKGYQLALSAENYEKARREGLTFTTRLNLPRPGAYEFRATVSDGLADVIGSAMQFVDIPAPEQGRLALTGIILKNESVPQDAAAEVETRAPGIFRPGVPLAFSYGILGAAAGPAKEARLRVASRVFATGRMVYQGLPMDLNFTTGSTELRQVSGKINLDQKLSPGEYVFEVEATDLLAKDPRPRTAMQYIVFQVRE